MQAVALGIKASAPRQLQTLELEPETSSSFDDPAWRSLLDLNGTYTYSPSYLQMLHSYNQRPIAPTFLEEGHYEFAHDGNPPDEGVPYVLRKQAYATMLAGGTGQFYGNEYTWPFKEGWRENIDSAGAQQIAYWKDFVLSLHGDWVLLLIATNSRLKCSQMSTTHCHEKQPAGTTHR